ncbi:hypothetical protein O181_029837 [Austropuccinia psidii MF-1]|uniref:CCHC-type domain-containing protein n=1 Tax=Austropuccinia psidii MF-1 TaxID=1389203 RepID=A0A9Q3H3V9_9BASI|nr:hypothetical protein [Austropuccinia psidii MF-1]
MKPQPQGHVMDVPYHQDDIKPDAIFMNKERSPSQYQDRDNMWYSEKDALKQLPESSSGPKFSGTGEYDHIELIDYIDGLFIDVPSIPDYWITARLNTAFRGHASIWYTKMKEIHGRRNWPWWKSQIIQKYSNDTWIWQRTISFENDKYSVDKDPYEWYETSRTLQDLRRRTNIGKYTPYKSSGFKEIQPFRVEFKEKPRERVAEIAKKKNSCHNCGSTDHYAIKCPKGKKNVYAIEKVPEEESPSEDYESDSMGDAIRKHSYDDHDPREEFVVEYQKETSLEIQDIQLKAGMPQDTANKNSFKHTQDAQKFLVTPAKGMAYIHGTATKMTILTRNYLENHSPNWENQLLPTKAKNCKSAPGNMTSTGTIIKEIIIPHRKGNIRLNPEFVVLDDVHIQGFWLGTDYQRMYGIDIYNSKNRNITIGTKKEKKFSLDIYQISAQDSLEELLNEFREGHFGTTLTSKEKLSLLKILRKNRPAFAIGEEPLGRIRRHDIELYLDMERPYPPMLRRPPYPASKLKNISMSS